MYLLSCFFLPNFLTEQRFVNNILWIFININPKQKYFTTFCFMNYGTYLSNTVSNYATNNIYLCFRNAISKIPYRKSYIMRYKGTWYTCTRSIYFSLVIRNETDKNRSKVSRDSSINVIVSIINVFIGTRIINWFMDAILPPDTLDNVHKRRFVSCHTTPLSDTEMRHLTRLSLLFLT